MLSQPPGVLRHFTASAFVVWEARVLLLRHSSKNLWLPPGGHVEPDESPSTAAVREVWEETGLRVTIDSPSVPAGDPRAAPRPEAVLEVEIEPGHVHIDLVYFARPAPAAEPGRLLPNEEAAELRWWSAAELCTPDPAAGPASLPPDVVSLGLLALRRAAD